MGPCSCDKCCACHNFLSLHHDDLQHSVHSTPCPHPLICLSLDCWKCAPISYSSQGSSCGAGIWRCVEGTWTICLKFLSFLIYWRFSSTEGQLRMALIVRHYHPTRDRVGHIAQLVGRYVFLLITTRILGKVLVCFLLYYLRVFTNGLCGM